MGVTQPAKFGEEWSDERIKSYLNQQAPANENADFFALITAYKHMRAYDFERFISFFVSEKRNILAKNAEGKTFVDVIKTHEKSHEFLKVVEQCL
jgi:hypothetical protein